MLNFKVRLTPWAVCFAACSLAWLHTAASRAAGAVTLNDNERIVLIGDAFVERLQTNGYFETILHTCLPKRMNIQIRNLGWSGDTVDGLARAVFGTPEDGYKRLLKDTREAKPTLIVVCYGGNEAHQGAAGLETFTKNLHRLLDDLQGTKARIAILAPTPHAPIRLQQAAAAEYNRKLEAYVNVLRETAADRKHDFVDISSQVKSQWKENGLHYSDYGYWRVAEHLAAAFGANRMPWHLHFDVKSKSYSATNSMLLQVNFEGATPLEFLALDRQSPPAVRPPFAPTEDESRTRNAMISISGLQAGRYRLTHRGASLAEGTAAEWARGLQVRRPGRDQVAVMRRMIVIKNELYFHRYRPQNETYLFLFRKHEQGNNAVEIPKFDPLVEQVEADIHRLKSPPNYRLQLQAVDG